MLEGIADRDGVLHSARKRAVVSVPSFRIMFMMKNILLTGLGNGLCRNAPGGAAAFPQTLVSGNARGSGSNAPVDLGFGIVPG